MGKLRDYNKRREWGFGCMIWRLESDYLHNDAFFNNYFAFVSVLCAYSEFTNVCLVYNHSLRYGN
jgi:hypothetical protein